MNDLRILYVGPDHSGSNGTCWRDAFVALGHNVATISNSMIDPRPTTVRGQIARRISGSPSPHSIAEYNGRIESEIARFRPDLLFFINVPYITPDLLDKAAAVAPRFAYMNDDMFNFDNQGPSFRENIHRLDWILTTKSYNVREFLAAGAPNATYVPNAYNPSIHCPVKPSSSERADLAGDVGFVGTFRRERADFLTHISSGAADLRLNVWGGAWEKMTRVDNWDKLWRWRSLRGCVHKKELVCSAMSKAINCNAVMLGLLFHKNRDLHTSRSFEIPACGGFMLAERTEEHRMYFSEDQEAVYFSDPEELISKLRFYVAHDSVRTRIAAAGYRKCLTSPYTYVDRARTALEIYNRLRPVMAGPRSTAVPSTI